MDAEPGHRWWHQDAWHAGFSSLQASNVMLLFKAGEPLSALWLFRPRFKIFAVALCLGGQTLKAGADMSTAGAMHLHVKLVHAMHPADHFS